MTISLAAVAAHLWQSTLCAAVVGLATLLLRKNHAAVRHALWVGASLKFLVPFAVLTTLAAQLAPRLPAPVVVTDVVLVMSSGSDLMPVGPAVHDAVATPMWSQTAVPAIVTVWVIGVLVVVARWGIRWRRIAAIARSATHVTAGRELEALRRIEAASRVAMPMRLVASNASLEPGVFGIIYPTLVWPGAIAGRLDDNQLDTILAHEVAHVRRHDNLTAAVHMAVQALFWFHPIVWWIGARLVDERERACDEAVVRLGHEPRVYAESILTACRMFLESPLPCVSGVTGSNLHARIEHIMRGGALETLTPMKKLLVAGLPAAAIVAPLVVGILDAPRLRAAARSGMQATGALPEFEVASVKVNRSGLSGKVSLQTQPGGRFSAENVTLRQLIRNAYLLQDAQVTGGPTWLDDDRFDILAKAAGDDLGDPFQSEQLGQPSRGQLMLRALLADRFMLQYHNETREMTTYSLVTARRDGTLGSALKRSSLDCSSPRPGCGLRLMPGNMSGGGASMSQLANSLAAFVGRNVFDRTELAGDFDFTLMWTPDQIPPGLERKAAAMKLPPIDPNGPSIFTALQEQLGLKLDAVKGPVVVLVVDRAEHPKEN